MKGTQGGPASPGPCSFTPVMLMLLVGLAQGQKVRDLVGIHRAKPALVPPMVLEKIMDVESPYRGNPLVDLKLPFHESVPARVRLIKGKRETLFRIHGDPPLKKKQFIVPGLLDLKLVYDKKARRTSRFEIKEASNRQLLMFAHSGSLMRLSGMEVCFVDLDYDGALGGPQDGFVLRKKRSRQWVKPGLDLELHKITEPLVFQGKKVWFQIDHGGFRAMVTTVKPDFTIERRKEYAKAVVFLNELRAKLGHAPVVLDPSLSDACEKHCLYCAVNGVTHHEEKDKPGYTRAGAKAGKLSELVPATNMNTAISSFLGGFFHRIKMLSPNLSKVGVGLVNGQAALDTLTHFRRGRFEPFAWPADGAKDVPVTWPNGEHPHPLGKSGDFLTSEARLYGYPITVTFPIKDVKDVVVKLEKRGGKACRLYVRSPEKPAQPKLFPDNMRSIFIMSEGRLVSQATYDVTVDCAYRGKPFQRKWSFTTR